MDMRTTWRKMHEDVKKRVIDDLGGETDMATTETRSAAIAQVPYSKARRRFRLMELIRGRLLDPVQGAHDLVDSGSRFRGSVFPKALVFF